MHFVQIKRIKGIDTPHKVYYYRIMAKQNSLKPILKEHDIKLRDVAQQANCSISRVSHVLNGDVHPITCKVYGAPKIEAAVRKLILEKIGRGMGNLENTSL